MRWELEAENRTLGENERVIWMEARKAWLDKEAEYRKENMISNKYAVKLCLEHEVRRGNKVVKKELIIVLRGEIYFVKFIINPKEDDMEPRVIFGRSFLLLTKAITDFEVGTITIYPDIDLLLEEIEEEGKSSYGKSTRNKKKSIENLNTRNKKKSIENLNCLYHDIGTSSSAGEEARPVIKTMAYLDKYKKILDEVWKVKIELDGTDDKKEKEAVKKIKGEALKDKNDPGAFIFPIRLKGQINKNMLADTGSDINTMPYRIYKQLGREDIKKVDRGIMMINHTQTEAMRMLTNVLCQVGVTTLIAKFLILDIPIDHDALIVVGRGFLSTIGGIKVTVTMKKIIKSREISLEAPIYGSQPASYLNCNDPTEQSLAVQVVINPFKKITVWKKAVRLKEHTITKLDLHNQNDPGNMKPWMRQYEIVDEVLLPQVHHDFLLWEGCSREAKSRYNTKLANLLPRKVYSSCIVDWDVLKRIDYDGEIDEMLRVRLFKEGSNEEIFTLVGMVDCKIDEKKRSRSLSALIYCRHLDTTTLRELIGSGGSLIPKVPHAGTPRVGIPRPTRVSVNDLYERIGRIKIRQEAIERMEYRQSYHWDRYHEVFEHMAGMYNIPIQGAYNPP
nr:hypothetical protein [Tanacetum cinerariifolium]